MHAMSACKAGLFALPVQLKDIDVLMQFMPLISVLAMFGVIAIVCCIIVALGPIAHVERNSKTYSAVKPPR